MRGPFAFGGPVGISAIMNFLPLYVITVVSRFDEIKPFWSVVVVFILDDIAIFLFFSQS